MSLTKAADAVVEAWLRDDLTSSIVLDLADALAVERRLTRERVALWRERRRTPRKTRAQNLDEFRELLRARVEAES